MSGLYTDGLPQLNNTTGLETAPFDTNASGGANPQSGALQLQQLALLVSFYGNGLSKTMVAGTRYYSSINIGFPQVITGVSVKIGTTGGTDNWIVELHGPTGTLLATSATAGTLAGTAATWQQIPFTTPYTLNQPGQYFLVLQSVGTTATFESLNAPTSSAVVTGSATGSFGTGASIVPPTTYTANLGPKALVYT